VRRGTGVASVQSQVGPGCQRLQSHVGLGCQLAEFASARPAGLRRGTQFDRSVGPTWDWSRGRTPSSVRWRFDRASVPRGTRLDGPLGAMCDSASRFHARLGLIADAKVATSSCSRRRRRVARRTHPHRCVHRARRAGVLPTIRRTRLMARSDRQSAGPDVVFRMVGSVSCPSFAWRDACLRPRRAHAPPMVAIPSASLTNRPRC
jgi:hypothetical protein